MYIYFLYIYICIDVSLSSVTSYALIDLFRCLLMVSPKVFQDVFVHLVYSSALVLTSCRSFVANLICIFVASRKLVLLSTLPKFIHSFRGQNGVPSCSSQKIHLDCRKLFLSSLWVQILMYFNIFKNQLL
jgi:hypothetical protein